MMRSVGGTGREDRQRTTMKTVVERTKVQFDVGADRWRDDDVAAPSVLIAE